MHGERVGVIAALSVGKILDDEGAVLDTVVNLYVILYANAPGDKDSSGHISSDLLTAKLNVCWPVLIVE